MKTFLLASALVLLVCLAAVLAYISAGSRDIPEPDTADLAVERPDIAPEDNAYTYWLSATNDLYWPITNNVLVADYLNEKPVDDAVIEEAIGRNEETLALVARGLACPVCLTPEVTGFDTPVPHIGSWQAMGRLLAAKVRHDRLAGRRDEAVATCASLLRFGDMIQADAGSVIDYLVGIAVLEYGLTQARDLVCDAGTSPKDRERLWATMAGIRPFDRGLIRAIKVEYRAAADAIDRIHDGRLSLVELGSFGGEPPDRWWSHLRMPGYLLQPNTTKLKFAGFYRDVIESAPLCYADMKGCDPEVYLRSNGMAKLITQPNGVGEILYGLMIPAIDVLLEKKCRMDCSLGATRLLLALHACERKEGALPVDLQSLVPVHLSAVTVDPYDGKPFRYSANKRIVYSVGKDLEDSGGSSEIPDGVAGGTSSSRRWVAKDIVFEIDHLKSNAPEGGRA